MIGADEYTLSNTHGSTIIVRRDPNGREKIAAYRAEIERLGIPMNLPAEEIRSRVWAAQGER